MLNTFTIGQHRIGFDQVPFIIAEMSGNHNSSLDRALAIVDAAAKAGAHAIKLQTYTADTMTINQPDGDFVIRNPKSPWDGRTLYNLYEEAATPWEWHEPLMKRAQERGIICFSSPFDDTAVDFLENLDVPCYKIASYECVDLPLITKAASTGKPLIISTGMATVAEISDAVEAARGAGCRDLALLVCTSVYPAHPEDSHLRTIPHLRDLFGCLVGLSDHTLGIGAAIASVALGSCIIEKHFTLSRADGGVDSAFSLEHVEMAQLIAETKHAWQALGTIHYGPTSNEKKGRTFRRSLYIGKDMEAGEVLSAESLRRIRPGSGLSPKYYSVLLGRKVTRAVRHGTPVTWDLIGPKY